MVHNIGTYKCFTHLHTLSVHNNHPDRTCRAYFWKIQITWKYLFRYILFPFIITGLLFFPWIPVLMKHIAEGSVTYTGKKVDIGFVSQIIGMTKSLVVKIIFMGYCFSIGETTWFYKWWITIPMGLSFGILFIGSLYQWKKSSSVISIMGLSTLTVILTYLIFSNFYSKIFSAGSFALIPSRFLFALPILYLWFSGFISKYIDSDKKKYMYIILIVITFGNFVGIKNYFTKKDFFNQKYIVPWQKIIGEIESSSKPTDILLTEENPPKYYTHNIEVASSQ